MIVTKILSVLCTAASLACCIFREKIPANVRDLLICWLSLICLSLAFAAA